MCMAETVITLRLNQQQLELMRPHHRAGHSTRPRLAGAARLREYAAAHKADAGAGKRAMTARTILSEFVLEPGTGKAIELRAGPDPAHRAGRGRPVRRLQLLQPARLQGVHALRPHPHRARLQSRPRAPSCGRRRRASGRCSISWKTPSGATTCCSRAAAPISTRAAYGFAVHTNCHDIQAEAQREYGLTPDDVHDSFNLFMCTEVADGRPRLHRPGRPRKAGDHVDLLALMDVLAVPNVCGADVMRTSNFSLKPLKLTVFAATRGRSGASPEDADPRAASARRRISEIRRSRPTGALRRDPGYVAEFPNTPIVVTELPISLTPEELR